MGINFQSLPTSIRTPFVGVEFSSVAAIQGPTDLPYKAVIVGQKLSSGTGTADTIVGPVTSVDQVIGVGGRGSILHRQAIGWFASNENTELWLGVLADNGSGVAATGTIVFGGTATAAGTIALYLGGVLVPVPIASGNASTDQATAAGTAINTNADLPVTASVASSTVTLTFRHKGLVGNSYDVRVGFNGETLPAGVTAPTITALGGVVAGTLNPTLTNLIAAMGDMWFQIWSHPYTDATSLSAIEADLLDRFGPIRSMDGVAFTSASGSLSTLTTLGNARNSGQSVIIAQPGASPLTPPMEFAAEVAGVVAIAAQIDPARPFQTLALKNAIATAATDRWSGTENNLFLHDGIATSVVGPGNVVQIQRAITTYKTSPAGSADTSYLDVTTMLTLLKLRFEFRTLFQNKYPRHKLAGDGAKVGPGQAIITPLMAKAEAVHWFTDMEQLGLVQNVDAFKQNLVVEINATDPNRLDFLLPPNLIAQLIVVAAQMQFRLGA
jgi:phage tail sheath gpL-like